MDLVIQLSAPGNKFDTVVWYHDDSIVEGEEGLTLDIVDAVSGDAGEYYCEISYKALTTTSNVCTVTVT